MTATTNLADLIVRLKQKHAALGDGGDTRSDHERAAWWAATTTIARVITGLQNPRDAKAERLLAECEAARAIVVAKQAELEGAIAAFEDWRTVADARARDAEYTRQWNVRRALERLREGTLTVGGAPLEPLDGLDRRIAELQRQIDAARAALDGHVRQAEALLGETVS